MSPFFFDLSARTNLLVTGADRVRFLNGQTTNDVHKATSETVQESCVLNAKGHLDAHLFLFVTAETIWIDADEQLRERLPARLEHYIIADDVSIEDVSERFALPLPQLGREWKLTNGTIHPKRLETTLGELRLRPEEIPADILSMFVRDAAKINQEHDKRLHQIMMNLASCFCVHAAATYLIEHEPWDFAAVYYETIDLLSHLFMNFHPPRRAGIYEPEFNHYSDVVNSAYRLHDAMLGRLLQLAGENVTLILVSDHGFKSGKNRPFVVPNTLTGIAAWHRPSGILVMRGNGLREDELIHGANLLDITPTILSLFGLPTARDMDGRVLLEAFSEPPQTERVETWEKAKSGNASPTTGDGDKRKLRTGRSTEQERALIQQFVEMGYIKDPTENPQEALKSTERENRWALAQSYLGASRHADALRLLESVFEEWPERWDFCCELALCQLSLGLVEEAQETVSGVIENRQNAGALLLRANLAYRSRHFGEGVKFLEQAEAIDSASVGLHNQIGLTRLRLRQPELAEVAFRKAIENDPDDPQAYLGLAFCRLRARQYEEAADFALQALALKFDLALAHHYLGVALARLGQDERAIQAFETCLHYRPGWNPAHRYLILLYKRRDDSADKVQRHREFLRGRIERREKWRAFRKQMRQEAVERARQRVKARRRLREKAHKIDIPASFSSEPMEFLVVSGLPRSGTSLMMQILAAAEIPLMTDDQRAADESNVRGYFEWEDIKQLPQNPFIIEKARGRATKVISMLLPSLPRHHKFRIIFMQRPIEEIAASQARLRQRLSGTSRSNQSEMASRLEQHRNRIVDLLRDSPNVELLEVEYTDLLEHPRANLERIAEFAKIDPSKIDIMASQIDPSLRHFATETHVA